MSVKKKNKAISTALHKVTGNTGSQGTHGSHRGLCPQCGQRRSLLPGSTPSPGEEGVGLELHTCPHSPSATAKDRPFRLFLVTQCNTDA